MSALISEAYRQEQMRLHAQPQGYGGRGRKWAETVRFLMEFFGARSVLDYGCGEGSLAVALQRMGIVCAEYDPAIPDKAALPGHADLVVCTDVLEHVEPDCLDGVLQHLRALTRKGLFLVVNLRESNKRLSDGRDAHILRRDPDWWEAQVQRHIGTPTVNPDAIPNPLSEEKRQKVWIALVTPEAPC